MPIKRPIFARLTIPFLIGLVLALPLTACGTDRAPEAAAKAAGPILVDPALTVDASIEALDRAALMRAPAPTIVAAGDCTDCGEPIAATLGERAADAGVARGKGGCHAKLQYGNAWANRMPSEFPVFPKAQLQEAAGVDGGNCDIRVASFTTSAPMQNVIDYYYTRARKSGFDAEHQIRAGSHVLGGTRETDGGAYFITFTTKTSAGTAVDIVANNGR